MKLSKQAAKFCMAAVLLLLCAGVWFLEFTGRSTEAEPIGVPDSQSAGGHASGDLPDGGTDEIQAPVDQVGEGGQRHDVPGNLSISVRDEDGGAVAGAAVSWSVVEEDESSRLAWSEEDVVRHLGEMRTQLTDADGVAAFADPPEDSVGRVTVVWATKPGHVAAFLGLEGGVGKGRFSLELMPSSVPTVLVLDSEGEFIEQARVYQFGIGVRDARAMGDLAAHELGQASEIVSSRAAHLALVRVVETGVDGKQSLPRGAGPTLLFAVDGGDRSPVRVLKEAASELVLQIANGAVLVEGQVAMDVPGKLPAGLRVKCLWVRGSEVELLAECEVPTSGHWGPADLPRKESGHLSFMVHGGGVFATPEEREIPADGGGLVVDFTVQQGIGQEVRVLDGRDEPLSPARVRILWQEQEAWAYAQGWTNEEGYARVEGCRPTNVWVRAEAAGHVTVTSAMMALPQRDDIVLVLEDTTSLRGRVTFDDEAVEEFSVLVWGDDRSSVRPHAFRNRLDGTFEIEGVPEGEIHVLASSNRYAESEVVTLEAGPEDENTVELELRAGVPGRGLVVDALSGEPLPDASIQRQTTYAGWTLGDRGEPQPVAADGRFTIEALSREEARIKVEAPDHVSVFADGAPVEEGGVEFGVISLAGRQTLRVLLEGEPPFDTDGWWFQALGVFSVPFLQVPPEGVLEIPDVAPGAYQMNLVHVDGPSVVQQVVLQPGEAWEITMSIAAGTSLDVEIKAPEGLDLAERFNLGARYLDERGDQVMLARPVPESRVVHFDRIGGERVSLELFDPAQSVGFGKLELSLVGPGPHRTELLYREPGFTVQLVGRPDLDYPRGYVGVYPVESPAALVDWAAPNEDGAALFQDPGVSRVLLFYTHPELAVRYAVVELETSEEQTLELELGPGLPVDLEVLDGVDPVSGAAWSLRPRDFRESAVDGLTDAAGRSGTKDLQSGTYLIGLSRAGYWTVEHEVEISSAGVLPLQLRRRGNVKLSFHNAAGTAISGASFSLRSLEFDTSVVQWREQRKLAAEAVELTTDAQGEARVVGIPHGEYEWSVAAPGGGVLSGRVTVPAGAWGSAQAVLVE